MLRNAQPNDVQVVSRLHYMAGGHFFSYFFASPELTALRILDRLYATPDTFCSQNVWWVAAEDNVVKGGIALYAGHRHHALEKSLGRYGRDIMRLAGLGATFKMAVRGLLNLNMPALAADELYIQALAALPEYRGQGLASGLLRFAFDEAARLGLPTLSLFVEIQNTHARAVYEHAGFRVTTTRRFPPRVHKHDLLGVHKMVADVAAH